jgi:hypothetical protein
VVLTATLDPGEDPLAAVRDLQRRAEETVEDHKRNVLKALEEEYALGEARTKLIGLARQLKAAQKEMDAIRAEWPEPIQQQLLGESEA